MARAWLAKRAGLRLMWKTMSLILPVMVPSWRFFSAVKPSPRVQFALLTDQNETPGNWQEFRPRPKTVTPFQMFVRLFWNPDWNETLFVVSCSERIQDDPTQHSIDEIRQRIFADFEQKQGTVADRWMQFRLVFVHRTDDGFSEEIVFTSEVYPNPSVVTP